MDFGNKRKTGIVFKRGRFRRHSENLLVLSFLSAAVLMISLPGCRTISTPRYPVPDNRNDAWAQDIAYLRNSFPKYNMSFTDETLTEFQEILDETYKAIPFLSDNEIYVSIMKAIAAAEDVHTNINLMPSSQKLRRLPIRIYWFDEGLFVVRTTYEYSEVLGSRVMEINGIPPEDLLYRMADVFAGSETLLRYESSYFLSSPDFLYGFGAAAEPESIPFKFEKSDGTTTILEFFPTPLGKAIFGYESWRELSPLSTVSQDAEGMLYLLKTDDVPLFLSSPNRSCSYEYMDKNKTLYVQINQNTNLNIKMSEFTKEVEEVFTDHTVDSVIVDLRFNTGGNLLLTTDLVKGIPEWHTGPGDIYIIIGGPTFSAGIVTAARLKYYAGDRAVLVGEPAAEGLKFWAETRFFTLPNSGLRLYAAYAYHNWENTNYDRGKRHFWLMKQAGVPAGDLDIDIPVIPSFADYLAGRDTIVETILTEVNQ